MAERNPQHSTFRHYFMQFKYVVDSVNNVIQNHYWWDRADKIKQNCFYVDHNQLGTLSPADFGEAQYIEGLKFAGKLKTDILELLDEIEQASETEINELKTAFQEIDIYASISEAINRKREK